MAAGFACRILSPSGVPRRPSFAKALPDFILGMIIGHAVELMCVEVRTAAGIERATGMPEAFQNSKASN